MRSDQSVYRELRAYYWEVCAHRAVCTASQASIEPADHRQHVRTATLTLFVAEDPSITPAISNFGIATTINGGVSPELDADYLTFPQPLNVSFHVYEGAGATAIVRGMIVGDPQLVLTGLALAPGQDANGFLVPEPATLALLGLSFAGLAASRRRKPI